MMLSLSYGVQYQKFNTILHQLMINCIVLLKNLPHSQKSITPIPYKIGVTFVTCETDLIQAQTALNIDMCSSLNRVTTCRNMIVTHKQSEMVKPAYHVY